MSFLVFRWVVGIRRSGGHAASPASWSARSAAMRQAVCRPAASPQLAIVRERDVGQFQGLAGGEVSQVSELALERAQQADGGWLAGFGHSWSFQGNSKARPGIGRELAAAQGIPRRRVAPAEPVRPRCSEERRPGPPTDQAWAPFENAQAARWFAGGSSMRAPAETDSCRRLFASAPNSAQKLSTTW